MGGISEQIVEEVSQAFRRFFLSFFGKAVFLQFLQRHWWSHGKHHEMVMNRTLNRYHDFASRWRWTRLAERGRGAVGVFRWEYWVDLGRFSVAKTSRCCRFSFLSSICRVLERWMDFEHQSYFFCVRFHDLRSRDSIWIPWVLLESFFALQRDFVWTSNYDGELWNNIAVETCETGD